MQCSPATHKNLLRHLWIFLVSCFLFRSSNWSACKKKCVSMERQHQYCQIEVYTKCNLLIWWKIVSSQIFPIQLHSKGFLSLELILVCFLCVDVDARTYWKLLPTNIFIRSEQFKSNMKIIYVLSILTMYNTHVAM